MKGLRHPNPMSSCSALILLFLCPLFQMLTSHARTTSSRDKKDVRTIVLAVILGERPQS